MKIRFLAVSSLLLSCLSVPTYSDVVVVGSADMPPITEKLARKIFLKKVTSLPGGVELIPIDLTDDNQAKWDFYKKVIRKKPSQIHAYWARALFSGIGNPPEQVNTIAELKERLGEPGVLGYIDAKDVEPSMNILLRISI